ncbi:Zinc transporter ZTP29 [Platanthera guangdongensis]|uniref:Zinc transporter ZTP29 n=1 Tax=Platanthera guangdongensis TaxID=2320717 RepID=A0ABR2MNE6_9ASPA
MEGVVTLAESSREDFGVCGYEGGRRWEAHGFGGNLRYSYGEDDRAEGSLIAYGRGHEICSALIVILNPAPNLKKLGLLQGFAAGLMLSISFFDLAHNALNSIGFLKGNLWFFAGVIFFALVVYFIPEPTIAPEENKMQAHRVDSRWDPWAGADSWRQGGRQVGVVEMAIGFGEVAGAEEVAGLAVEAWMRAVGRRPIEGRRCLGKVRRGRYGVVEGLTGGGGRAKGIREEEGRQCRGCRMLGGSWLMAKMAHFGEAPLGVHRGRPTATRSKPTIP